MSRTLYATLLCACLTQAGARREAIKSHDASEDPSLCFAVTRGIRRKTHKRQTEKCKCPVGYFVSGDNPACQTYSRYFSPELMEGLGCACTSCSDTVANSNMRNTAHKQDFDKCKCPKNYVVSGNSKECFSLEPSRYFDPIKLRGKGCQCLDEEEVSAITPAAEVTSSTTTIKESTQEEIVVQGTPLQDCESICEEVYRDAVGMNYKNACQEYCQKAIDGEDPCKTCKYVTDRSGYHKACRFFMTAFNDPENEGCYHKPLDSETCDAEMFLDEMCSFVGWDVMKKINENEKACTEVYKDIPGATYESSCKTYSTMQAEGKDACETCKYAPTQSGYHNACRFFMTAFHDSENEDCYHKPLNTKTCPKEAFLDPECPFVGFAKMNEAKQQGLI